MNYEPDDLEKRVAEIESLADGTPSTRRAIANAVWRERHAHSSAVQDQEGRES